MKRPLLLVSLMIGATMYLAGCSPKNDPVASQPTPIPSTGSISFKTNGTAHQYSFNAMAYKSISANKTEISATLTDPYDTFINLSVNLVSAGSDYQAGLVTFSSSYLSLSQSTPGATYVYNSNMSGDDYFSVTITAYGVAGGRMKGNFSGHCTHNDGNSQPFGSAVDITEGTFDVKRFADL
jgi:hypothetical protein